MANNIGARHLADNNALYEPSRSNAFEFVITDIDNLLQAGVNAETADGSDYIRGAQEVLRVSVASTFVPHFSLSTIDVKRGNSTIHFAGVPTFDSGSLVLNDYIGARTKDALLAWQALAYDVQNEAIKSASSYKKDCQLIEYTPDFETVVRTWDLKGCWISGLSEDTFSYDTDGKREITATIVYDRAIPHKPEFVAE